MTVKTLLPVGRVFRQQAGVRGELSAYIVGATLNQSVSGFLRVAFVNTDGRTAVWPLSISNNNGQACCVIVGDRLIVASRDVRTNLGTIDEYSIPADPFAFPPIAFPQVIAPFGDNTCRDSRLAVLPTGEVICLIFTQYEIAVYGALRLTSGEWKAQGKFTIPTTNGGTVSAHDIALATTPWANEAALFIWTDGGRGVDVGFFAVVNGTLVLAHSLPGWVHRETLNGAPMMGELAPAGEYPYWEAITDWKNKRILVSYTNIEGRTVTAPSPPAPRPQQNCSLPVVASMQSDLVPRMVLKGPEIVVAILNASPVCIASGAVSLTYRPGYPINGGMMLTEGAPAPVAIPCKPAYAFGYSPIRREIVVQQPDDSVALIQLDAVVPPNPQPIPPSKISISAITTGVKLAVVVMGSQDPDAGAKVQWTSTAVPGRIWKGPVFQEELPKKDQDIVATVTDANGVSSLPFVTKLRF